jgi:hypothetical protein
MRLDFPGIEGNIDIYMKVLRAICGDTVGKSMIDIGACFAPNTPKLGFSDRTYIDIIDRKLDHPEEQQYFHQADILNIPTKLIRRYSVALCLDCIEHLTVPDGYKLLKIMEHLAGKYIIFTPTTDLFGLYNDDTPEAHRSVWSPEMLKDHACIVFPDYHKEWGGGAMFSWNCEDIEKDFERVKNLIQL